MKITKFITGFLTLVALSFPRQLLSEELPLEPDIPLPTETDNGGRPRVPSRIQLTAYIDADVLTICSSVDCSAQISVTDISTGDEIIKTSAWLMPDYALTLSNLSVGDYLIKVTIGSNSFIGYFSI